MTKYDRHFFVKLKQTEKRDVVSQKQGRTAGKEYLVLGIDFNSDMLVFVNDYNHLDEVHIIDVEFVRLYENKDSVAELKKHFKDMVKDAMIEQEVLIENKIAEALNEEDSENKEEG